MPSYKRESFHEPRLCQLIPLTVNQRKNLLPSSSVDTLKRGAEASLVVAMGRRAVHTGQIVTFEDMLNCDEGFAPGVDKLTMDSPALLQLGPDGKYPQPQPGMKKTREF